MFKFKSFYWKNWFFIFILLTSFSVLLVGILVNYQLQREENMFLQQHFNIAEIIAHSLERGYKTNVWPFEVLGEISKAESTSFIWVVKPDNRIFWANNVEMMGKTVPISYDIQTEIKDSFFYEPVKLIILPVKTELGKEPWVLLFGVSLKPISQARQEIFVLSGSLLFFLLILAGIISYYFSKKIFSPLQRLQEGTKKIGKGQLDYRINIKTGDELEELGGALNQMAEDLQRSYDALKESEQVLKIKVKARTKELEELNQQLEEKVKQRTKDLEQRIEELERFHRLTVGREMKMIDLKKELKQAKQKIKDLAQKKQNTEGTE